MNDYFEKWFNFCQKKPFIIRGVLGFITILIAIITSLVWELIVIGALIFD